MIAVQRTNTILYCRRWAATVQFYRDQLRLPVAFANDWFVEFQLNAAAYLLSLIHISEPTRPY